MGNHPLCFAKAENLGENQTYGKQTSGLFKTQLQLGSHLNIV